MAAGNDDTIKKVVARLSQPPKYADGVRGSILAVAAASYGSRPTDDEDVTQPTGFDPEAAALFEAVVESAYLVANADGEFDDTEKTAFQHVVLAACTGSVAKRQIEALLADLADQLEEDGMDKRIDMVSRTISRPEHAREVLKVAALLAAVSAGVSAEERSVLDKLASKFGLGSEEIETALSEVSRVMG